jgi:hypothetical protein
MEIPKTAEYPHSDGEAGITLKHSLDVFYRHLSMGLFFSLLSRTSLANLRSSLTAKYQDMNSPFERAFHRQALRAVNRNDTREQATLRNAVMER